MNLYLIIMASMWCCVLCLPVIERKKRLVTSSESILNAITGANLLNNIINDISIRQLYNQRMYNGAKSICDAFTYFKYASDSNSTTSVDAACSESVSSVVLNSMQSKSCSWINGGSSIVLPECELYPQEVDLTCHELQLADLAYRVKVTLPGNHFYRVRDNLSSWVSRFVNQSQVSEKAYRLISRQIY